MNNYVKFKNDNGLIAEIFDKYDIYTKTGCVEFRLKPGATEENAQEISNLLAEHSIKSYPVSGVCWPSNKLVHFESVEINPSSLRTSLNIFLDKNVIEASSRAACGDFITGIEKKINLKTIDTIELAQTDVINKLFGKLYFSGVFEAFKDIRTIINAIDSYFWSGDLKEAFEENGVNINHLNEEQIQGLQDDRSVLKRCFSGKASLEPTLERLGSGIPNLKLQRMALFASIKKNIKNEFPDLTKTSQFLYFMKLNTLILDVESNYNPSLMNINYIQVGDYVYSADDFLNIVQHTMQELDISPKDLASTIRFELMSQIKQCIAMLDNVKVLKLTDKETFNTYIFCNEFLNSEANNQSQLIDNIFAAEERVSSFSKNSIMHKDLIDELKFKSKEIKSQSFLGTHGVFAQNRERKEIRRKCLEAAESRMKPSLEL